MKRKLCSVLLALCMVLTLLPVSAMADDGAEAGESAPAEVPAAETEYVAQIGNQGYATLAKAVEAAESGATITLLNDVALDSTLTLDKNLILDLNGHVISNGNNLGTNYLVKVANGAEVSIIGNKENSSINDTRTNSTGTITAICVFGNLTVDGAELTISRGVNGIAIKVDESGADKLGKLTVKSGKISSTQAIQNWGITTIDGGTFTGDVGSHAYSNIGGDLTINGGIFNGPVYSAQLKYDGWPTASAKTKIVNGTFNGLVAEYYDDGTNGLQPVERSDKPDGDVNCKVSISGGAFTDLANAVKYATDGATIKLAGDVTVAKPIEVEKSMTLDLNGHVLTAATASTETVKNSAIWVTDQNVNLTIDGMTAGSGMKMGDTHSTDWKTKVWGFVDLRPGSDGSTVTVNGGRYVGSTCASDNYHYTALFTVGSESKLVLNNVSAETDERVVKAPACGEVIVSGGTYNITGIDAFLGAAFETKTASFTNMKLTAKYGGCVQVGNNATFENCEIKVTDIRTGEGTHLNCAVAVQYGGTATVKSGIYTAPYAAYVYSSGGTINIENGTFTGVVRADATTDATATINIKNGSFNGEIQKGAGAGNETIAITGGTYTSDPSAYVVPGYVASYNGSTYTVYYPVPVTPGNNNNSSSTTTKNPDGSTTTTTTDKATGTVTETTKNPDGSTTTVETKKDGSVTETNKTANGSVGTVKTDANGNSEISANISAADVNAAAKKSEPVAAPVSVAPAASPAAAPVIKLSVPASAGEVSVVIPVVNAQQGTVAIKVNPDGTEEIIKTSVVTKDGVVLGVKGSAQIKIVNNDKDFADTVGHWAESDVDFVSARELFTGTAPQTFSPESATTRGMVVTVLARLAGESTDGGANWYDKGCAWAVTNGVSDGTDPNGTVTREQLAAMLYRYFGSPAVSGSLSFADASSVSEYAHDAMQWCVNNGIINGMDGLLNPQGQATRAQVSAMFARYIRLMSTK